jgi:hypothetical protein
MPDAPTPEVSANGAAPASPKPSVAVSTPAATPKLARAAPKVIAAGKTGGSMGVDSFLRSMGEDPIVDAEDIEPEESVEEPVASAEVVEPGEVEDGSDKEGGETPATEEAQQEKEAEATTSKAPAIRAKTADGKDLIIPSDAVILWKVDGEVQEIPLKEHMNIVAGELTVNQRLGKLASYREELRQENERITSEAVSEREENQEVMQLFASGNSAPAFCKLAERLGTSPVQMYRTMLAEVNKAYKAFEGWSQEKIENHFLNLETNWMKEKEKKSLSKEAEKTKVNTFIGQIASALKNEGLDNDQFVEAVDTLVAHDPEKWKTLSLEQRRDAAVEQALYTKHLNIIGTAIDSVNPKLRKDEKLIKDIIGVTNPHEWSSGEIAALIKNVLGDRAQSVATNLSKRAGNSPQNSQKRSVAKQDKMKPVKSLSDIRAMFKM